MKTDCLIHLRFLQRFRNGTLLLPNDIPLCAKRLARRDHITPGTAQSQSYVARGWTGNCHASARSLRASKPQFFMEPTCALVRQKSGGCDPWQKIGRRQDHRRSFLSSHKTLPAPSKLRQRYALLDRQFNACSNSHLQCLA
jgi:hypothetical protein